MPRERDMCFGETEEEHLEEMCFGPHKGHVWAIIFGLLLVFFGLVLYLQQFYEWLQWQNIWPFGLIALGLLIIVASILGYTHRH